MVLTTNVLFKGRLSVHITLIFPRSNLSKRHKTQNCVSFSRYVSFISALNNTQTHPIKPPCCFTERPGVESDSHAYVVIFVPLGSNPATQLFPLVEGASGLFI